MLALGGCAALPNSGPTEARILRLEKPNQNPFGIQIVPLNAATVQALDIARGSPLQEFDTAPAAPGADGRIGVGDVLDIAIFEVGSSLFAPSSPAVSAEQSAGPSGSVNKMVLPPEQVGADGTIVVPYAGRIQAAGLTPEQLGTRIQAGLAGQSQNPQVLVDIEKNNANSVIVSGAVRKPGRYPLSLTPERLLDAVAIAGGPEHESQDEDVELLRGGQSAQMSLGALEASPQDDVYLQPGDRIALFYDPRTFTVFGAAQKVERVDFATPELSLADALAQAGGPSDYQADPQGIFIFRFEPPAVAARLGIPADGRARVPVVYQLDMLQPASYFLAQEFAMHNHDLLYIANAETNRVAKLFGLIANLVAPASTVNNFR